MWIFFETGTGKPAAGLSPPQAPLPLGVRMYVVLYDVVLQIQKKPTAGLGPPQAPLVAIAIGTPSAS